MKKKKSFTFPRAESESKGAFLSLLPSTDNTMRTSSPVRAQSLALACLTHYELCAVALMRDRFSYHFVACGYANLILL